MKILRVHYLLFVGFLAVVASVGLLAFPALAVNTHSTDLEQGNSQYWSISDAAQTGLDFSDVVTMSAWVKFESTTGTQIIVSKYNGNTGGPGRAYIFYVDHQNDQLIWTSRRAEAAYGCSSADTYVSWNPSAGTWYHIAAVKSGTTVKLYVNGSQLETDKTCTTSDIQDSNAEFILGTVKDNGTAADFFDGLIDDVRVWSRNLSSTEISNLYNTTCSFSNGSNLQGWWKLDNDGNDVSGNGNHLVNNGSATFTSDVPYTCNAPTITYFNANPSSIVTSASSMLSWSVSSSTLVTIDNGIGSVSASSTTSVSPSTSTTYTLTASYQGIATSTAQVTVVVASPAKVRKSSDQSITNSTFQNDSQLVLAVSSGKTYLIEGLLIASSTSATPDLKIAFTAPSGSNLVVGHISTSGNEVDGGALQSAGAPSVRIEVPGDTPTPVLLRGTLVTANSGTLQLQWAQFISNVASTTIGQGSYLKVEEI